MSTYGGRTLSSMSLRDIEDGGMRFYAAKGRFFGEDREDDGWDSEAEWDFALSDIEPPAERITETDIDIAAEEALRHDEEMFIVEMTFDPDL